MQTDGADNPPTEVNMEIDIEEQKKRACIITPLAGATARALMNDEKNTTHDMKKICNNRTPLQTLKPDDTQKIPEDTVMDLEIKGDPQIHEKKTKSIQEREKPLEGTNQGSSTEAAEMGHNIEDNAQDQTPQNNMTLKQEVVEAEAMVTMEVVSGPMEAMPKEWQQHHDQWLTMMQAAMGEENHPKIPKLQEKVQVLCPGPDLDINITPAKEYVTRFNLLHIKVAMGESQVKLFHQAFCKWYLKLREADTQAIIYLWASRVWDKEGILIKNLTDIPTELLLLKKFIPKLFLQTTGGAYHMQVLLGTTTDLETIMETIG